MLSISSFGLILKGYIYIYETTNIMSFDALYFELWINILWYYHYMVCNSVSMLSISSFGLIYWSRIHKKYMKNSFDALYFELWINTEEQADIIENMDWVSMLSISSFGLISKYDWCRECLFVSMLSISSFGLIVLQIVINNKLYIMFRCSLFRALD